MKALMRFFVVFLVAIFAVSCNGFSTSTYEAEVITRLKAAYPVKEGSAPFEHLMFVDNFSFPRTIPEITEVSYPQLKKIFPDYHFFETYLYTGAYEFPHIPVIVSLDVGAPADSSAKVAVSFLDDVKFFDLLKGAKVEAEDDRKQLCYEASLLFAHFVYEGNVTDSQLVVPEGSYVYEIVGKIGSDHYIMTCRFSSSGELQEIEIGKQL